MYSQNIMMTQELEEEWATFLERYYGEEIVMLSNEYPNKRSVNVVFADITKYDFQLADSLISEPDIVLDAATRALREMDLVTGIRLEEATVRIVRNLNRVPIRAIRHVHIGKLVSIEGIVIKATEVKPKLQTAVFECPHCGHIFAIEQANGQFEEPYECPREEGGCGRKARRFKLNVEKSKFVDSQKLRLQEPLEELCGGDIPHVIDVEVEGDITDKATPGTRVTICGILRSKQQKTSTHKKLVFDIYLEANSIERKNEGYEEIELKTEDEEEIIELSKDPLLYDKLVKSIAPFILGYDEIKEALLLQLFGGTEQIHTDGSKVRGDIHILLVGDPGIAKSKLLLSQANLSPRGLYASGKTTSAAGLTAAVVKDEFGEGRWTLEAGALVLADRGIAAVDEIDKMEKTDRDALHEALEQQTVSIAKAGIIARLNSRCALLAAANPVQGRFDKYTPLSEQINLPASLLSRFDLIFLMMDRPNEEIDAQTADFLILARTGQEANGEEQIPASLLRKYVAYSKQLPAPRMSEEAWARIKKFYVDLRGIAGGEEEAPVPITVRQLESLMRLSEARARTRLSNTVTEEDADCAIRLMSHCMKEVYVDPESGRLDVDVVEVGTSKTRRDRARTIREIISDLEREYGAEVPLTEVYDMAEEEGIEREKAEEAVEVMKRDGILFSPGVGVVRFVK